MPETYENTILNLIRISDKTDPEMVRAIQLLLEDVYKMYAEVFVEIPKREAIISPPERIIGTVQNFAASPYPTNLRLDWDNLPGAFRYEIRMGLDWDTAKPIVVTATDVANVDPIFLNLVYGNYQFMIRAWNLEGKLGPISIAPFNVPIIPPPDLALEVVVSTVLLRWTVPISTWKIDHYVIYKDNIPIGTINGTFKLIQEQVGGDYAYSVEAVDIVGNVSTRSAVKIASLHDPSEFEFVDELDADYTGDYDHTAFARIDNIAGVLGPTNIHTWKEHYEFYGFISPEDQVNKGYPIYYQPTFVGDGTYEEVFDFGQIYKNLTVVADYNKLQINGNSDVHTEISYSEDGINWSDPVTASSVLATSFRYVKVKWHITNADDKAAVFLSNLKVILNVTLTLDSGSADALASDVGGTEVFYNKDFTGINSVTATAATSLQPLYAVCDEVTKDSFKVLVFDSSGNRVNATINWKARGVI